TRSYGDWSSDVCSSDLSYRPSTLWTAMKEHLCLMLTHHLISLAIRLGFMVPLNFERTLIHRSTKLWDKPAGFVWTINKNKRDGRSEERRVGKECRWRQG